MRDEVVPVCDGVVIHPGTPDQERLTWAAAHRRGVVVDDPLLQEAIDGA